MDLDFSDCTSLHEGELDADLISATLEAIKTGKLTPLLKTELKCRIQKKCFEEGKDLTLDDEPQLVQRKAPVSLWLFKYMYWIVHANLFLHFLIAHFFKSHLLKSNFEKLGMNILCRFLYRYLCVYIWLSFAYILGGKFSSFFLFPIAQVHIHLHVLDKLRSC